MGRLIGDRIVSRTANGLAINLENFILFRLAYTLGNTSPKSKIKKVTKNTSTINFKIGFAITSKNDFPTNEKIITTPMWLKLFATNIVANNFLGFWSNFEIKFALEGSSSNNSLMSF